MSQFLVDRYEAVERLTSIRNSKDGFTLNPKPSSQIQTYASQENLTSTCKLCNENHSLRICPKFRAFTVQQRVDFVFQNKFCNNCLAVSHLKANCKSKHTCIYCKKSHHSLLHMPKKSQTNTQTTGQISVQNSLRRCENSDKSSMTHNETQKRLSKKGQHVEVEELPTSSQVHANCSAGCENILLRTALVQIECRDELFTLRALIDPGSQRTFLTEKMRNRLQLPYHKSNFEIVGIGGQKQLADKECELVLYARRSDTRIPIKAIVLPKVTRRLPAYSFDIPRSKELEELDLADPTFNRSSQIDLILCNDYERFINTDGIRRNICGRTSAYKTIFGWVLSGPIDTQTINTFTTTVSESGTPELNVLLKKFWEDEGIPSTQPRSIENEFCEELYARTTTRLENGRYMVRLPFKTDFPGKLFLGSSRYIALAQYTRMEKTLSNDPELCAQYEAVLGEYLTLYHMEETSSQEIISQGKYFSYYLPHHAVVRPEHKTTKVRVVFNASRKSKSNFSLNDVLHTGPTL